MELKILKNYPCVSTRISITFEVTMKPLTIVSVVPFEIRVEQVFLCHANSVVQLYIEMGYEGCCRSRASSIVWMRRAKLVGDILELKMRMKL